MEKGGWEALYNHILNIAIDICLKTLLMARNEMENIDGTISVNDIESKSWCLFASDQTRWHFTNYEDKCREADTELENNEIDINIMGTLAEQEHEIPSADVLAKSIMDD